MASKWQTATIDEVAEKVAMGPFGSSIKVETFVPSGVPIISGQHLQSFKVDETPGFNFISLAHACRLKNANVQRGDIIFTHAGNIGQVSYIPATSIYVRYIISQRQFYMRCDRSKVIPEFVVAYFKTREGQHKLLANTSQVGVPSIAQPVTYLRTIEIPLPSLDEQHAITKILSDFNEKIEFNMQMNKTLESIAKAIFKRWFIDFEFPDENGKPYKSYGGEMIASEWGMIPKIWKDGSVIEAFNLTMGQSPPGKTYNEIGEGVAFFQGRADFSFRFPTERVFCTAPSRFANPSDTLVTVRAPVGDINMALQECCIGRGLAAIKHKSSSRSFTYYSMQSLRQIFNNYEAEGTVFGSIGKDDFNLIRVVIPSLSIVQDFEKYIYPIDQLIEENEKNMSALASIRDSLLQKLMQGEVSVCYQ